MGNQRLRLEREGFPRPFPEERVAESEAAEVAATRAREQTRERVRRHRLLKRITSDRAQELDSIALISEPEHRLSRRTLSGKVKRIVEVLQSELGSCPGPSSRSELLEVLWSHPSVKDNLPEFYLPPREAKAQMEVIDNLTTELDAVKGVQSTNKLVVRGALLSAAVSSNISDVSAIARILKTKPSNIKNARYRRRALQESGSSVWVASRRRQRSDVLSEATVQAVLLWWDSETRVSPNKKDVVKKRHPGIQDVEVHATHYLLESQVRISNYICVLGLYCSLFPFQYINLGI